MKKIKKLKIGSVLLYLCLLILLLNLISVRVEKAFDIIGFRTYTVLSGSMEPKVYPGDVVIVVNKNKIKLKKGDVITFKDKEDVVTHRIIEKNQKGYITKGDNNNVPDSEVVSYENIIGKVVFSIPKVGYIIEILSIPWVMLMCVLLFSVIILKKDKNS